MNESINEEIRVENNSDDLEELNNKDVYCNLNNYSDSRILNKKKKIKMLSTFSILFLIILFIIFLSWIFHLFGVTVTEIDKDGKNQIQQKIQALGILDIFLAPLLGLEKQVKIIGFLLIVGAFINIVIQTKTLEGFSQSLIYKLKGKEIWTITPLMLFFSICGTVEGMAEETIPFYAFSIPLMLLAGFDVLTGFIVVFLGAGIGVIASTVVPFSIVIAVNALNTAAGVNFINIGDGLFWRFATWFVLTTITIIFVTWYAYKVKKNPQLSYTFKTLEEDKKFFLSKKIEKINITWKHKFTLFVFFLMYFILMFYMTDWDKIFNSNIFENFGNLIKNKAPFFTFLIPGVGHGSLLEMSSFFLISTIILGFVNGFGETKFIKDFITGSSNLLSVALVIAIAAGISIVLERSHIQNLVLNGISSMIGTFKSDIGKVIFLFFIFIPISALIPSTSGFANVVFPLLINVVAIRNSDGTIHMNNVLGPGSISAFVNANGLINICSPTSAILMGCLAVSKIEYLIYLKFIWKYLIVLIILIILMLVFSSLM